MASFGYPSFCQIDIPYCTRNGHRIQSLVAFVHMRLLESDRCLSYAAILECGQTKVMEGDMVDVMASVFLDRGDLALSPAPSRALVISPWPKQWANQYNEGC